MPLFVIYLGLIAAATLVALKDRLRLSAVLAIAFLAPVLGPVVPVVSVAFACHSTGGDISQPHRKRHN